MALLNIFDDNLNYIRELSGEKRISKEVKEQLLEHSAKYRVYRVIAWYRDMNDFYSDWDIHCNYTTEEADELIRSNPAEFQLVEDLGILRYEV